MLSIVIPMAGFGQRFVDAGYAVPKPFIPIHGKPMIRRITDCLIPSSIPYELIFICLSQHEELLRKEFPKEKIVTIDSVTRGSVCSVLHARDYIDKDSPILLSSCDQLLDWNPDDFYEKADGLDGCLVTYKSLNKHHSYARLDNGLVVETAEKSVISDNANVGIYYFGSGSDFVTAAELLLHKNDHFNNEYYLAPVYNHLIGIGKTNIKIYQIPEENCHILGTPVEIRSYLKGTR